jgi:glycosyltransferase involved in cell wall biosynthesis
LTNAAVAPPAAAIIASMPADNSPVRVLRVIARMNLGGPAHHVALLSERLDPEKYESTLATGKVGRGEEEFPLSSSVVRIDALGPDIRPVDDLKALLELVRLIRRLRPEIVETHTSKAGMLGRAAALLAMRPRPILIHTYHGHVLSGYFGPLKTATFRGIERALARATDLLVGVSAATVEELVALRIAPRSKFRVLPLGLDLEPMLALPAAPGGPFREEIGASAEETVFTYTGRLVPIKRPEAMLRATALARQQRAPVRVAVVGDGEMRPRLEELARELGCAEAVSFVGYRRDLVTIARGSDAALLTSANEGTPVALIEAAAAARPAVATNVGGVRDIVVEGAGLLAPPGDEQALAEHMVRLASEPELRRQMGERAREHVRRRFALSRLIEEVEEIYSTLLARRSGRRS